MNKHPVKMARFEFKGEETINEWSLEIEEIAIQMSCTTNKQGRSIYIDTNLMIREFMYQCQIIRDFMNSTDNDFDNEE